MTSSRVSVIIPSYNCEKYLAEAVDSALAQTRPPDEVIVVDDGSTDGTRELVRPYRERVRYHYQDNTGLAGARNTGLDLATGDWVAFLDSDDVWRADKLERQLELVERDPGLVCVHTGFYLFGDRAGEHPPAPAVLEGRYDRSSLLRGLPILPATLLVRGGLPVRFRTWARVNEDRLYCLDLLPHGRFGYVPEPLYGYRRHAGAMTRQPGAVLVGYDALLRWARENAARPDEADPLEQEVLRGVADEVRLARWQRDWPRYWVLRNYLAAKWAWPSPPDVLGERVYPRLVYVVKDWLDAARRRFTREGRPAGTSLPPQVS